MKNLLMIIVVAAIAMTSCKDDTQNLSTSFDNLQRESDSLRQVHSVLKNHHEMHVNAFNSVNQRMAGTTFQDSSWLETIANQRVVLKNHEAEIQKVEQIFAGHNELKSNFPNLTQDEMQAQVDAMKSDLESIKSLQSTLSGEHERLDNELTQIEEGLREQELKLEGN